MDASGLPRRAPRLVNVLGQIRRGSRPWPRSGALRMRSTRSAPLWPGATTWVQPEPSSDRTASYRVNRRRAVRPSEPTATFSANRIPDCE